MATARARAVAVAKNCPIHFALRCARGRIPPLMARMRTAAFLQRLQTELPVWVRQGWVAPQHQQSILNHVAQQARGSPRYLIFVLSAMVALLLGAGVVTFFAAN